MNWDKIEQLLNVAEASVKWPRLRAIHDAALAELHKHAEQRIERPASRAELEKILNEPEADVTVNTDGSTTPLLRRKIDG